VIFGDGTVGNGPVKYERYASWSSINTNKRGDPRFVYLCGTDLMFTVLYLGGILVKHKVKHRNNRTTCSRDELVDKVCSNLFSFCCKILAALNQ
jgi:hypothetical protein